MTRFKSFVFSFLFQRILVSDNKPLCFAYREFAKTLKRPFTVNYNPYTQSVDVLRDTSNINNMVKDIRHELDIVEDALRRLGKLQRD